MLDQRLTKLRWEFTRLLIERIELHLSRELAEWFIDALGVVHGILFEHGRTTQFDSLSLPHRRSTRHSIEPSRQRLRLADLLGRLEQNQKGSLKHIFRIARAGQHPSSDTGYHGTMPSNQRLHRRAFSGFDKDRKEFGIALQILQFAGVVQPIGSLNFAGAVRMVHHGEWIVHGLEKLGREFSFFVQRSVNPCLFLVSDGQKHSFSLTPILNRTITTP